MTERGPHTGLRGASDPTEPSPSGDAPAPAPASRPFAAPVDLSAVRRTDALIESLAARDAAGTAAGAEPSAGGPAEGAAAGPGELLRPGRRDGEPDTAEQSRADDRDPAVRLLRALIVDVDDQASDDRRSDTPGPPAPSGPGPRRRGPRTIVALGVAGAVLASSGVAVAGGGAERTTASPAPSASGVAEEAGRTVDTEAGVLDRPRPPARPAPERPAVRTPSGDPDPDPRQGREDYRPFKRRGERGGPRRIPRRPPLRQEAPMMATDPADRPETQPVSDPRLRLDDLRRMARSRALGYQDRSTED
ncbi:hypothetical protein [Actinomadura sp. WMMA1423]|uniref:hypothetical protein n=1 Tax=Actinomadura sp. WMMA1423 TaxID=2591108 RepID=UPI0011467929|nr:hypothetical protein [Actinomadura sp. WMMA1423]